MSLQDHQSLTVCKLQQCLKVATTTTRGCMVLKGWPISEILFFQTADNNGPLAKAKCVFH